jgi:hypothetical protein
MFGSGDMYLPQNLPSSDQFDGADNLSDTHPIEQNLMLDFDSTPQYTPQIGSQTPQNFNSVRSTHPEIVREEVKIADKPQRKVIEIRVFYDDQTWDTFVPAKK